MMNTKENVTHYQSNASENLICSRCIYDTSIPNIFFNDDGVCNFCIQVDELKAFYGTETDKGQKKFQDIISEIKLAGAKKKYDCIIGVSGGTDSSYLLLKAKEWGLRVLAVHYDNTWNTATATMNIAKVTKFCDFDLWTHVVDNSEIDDIKRSFLLAGVREFDADTDMALIQTLRAAAVKFDVKYILEGHSFIAEGISPIGSNYFDGKYVAEIHKIYGKKKAPSFPNMLLWDFIKFTIFYRQKFIRPFWYLKYDKEGARKELIEKTGWKYYDGHHLENYASKFLHTVWLPKKFQLDFRYLELAAKVRANIMTKQEALDVYSRPLEGDEELIEYVKKRVNLGDEEYNKIIASEGKMWTDFKTYKTYFEKLEPLFRILADKELIPRSFYLKYCFPIGSRENE